MTTQTTEFEGWLVTHDYINDGTAATVGKYDVVNRVGYGQREAQADATQASFDRVIGRTVEIETELKPSQIKDPVLWRLKQDDELIYAGLVSAEWILGGDEDFGYNIWRFCEADVGGGELEFRAADLPAEFVAKHPANCVVNGWVTVYG